MQLIKRLIYVVVLFFSFNVLSADEIDSLLPLYGKEYEKERDNLLKKRIELKAEKTPDKLLLVAIMKARKKHPKIFSDLPTKIIQPAYLRYQKENNGLISPYTFIKGAVSGFMRQGGIEKKEYITTEVTEKSEPNMVEVKHLQTDEQVKKTKEINNAARLAVIEYLWKIESRWRVKYEVMEIFYDMSKRQKLDERFLTIFENVFKRSTHPLVFDISLKIFTNEKFTKTLPLVRKKLNRAYADKDFRYCYCFVEYIRAFGSENDKKILDAFIKLKKEAEAKQKVKDKEKNPKQKEEPKKLSPQEEKKFNKDLDSMFLQDKF